MDLARTHPRLAAAVAALGHPETDPATRALIEVLGGAPATVRERSVGVPAFRSRRMLFASGEEVVLRDDAVAAVILRVTPTPTAPSGVDLTAWVAGIDGAPTLDDLAEALGSKPRFAGLGAPYFVVAGAVVRATFRDNRGWKQPGNLETLVVAVPEPGSTRPEDDECPGCADLLARDAEGGVDVDATVDALSKAVEAGQLREDAHWVRLADLRALHGSGSMDRAESQLRCAACGRILCLTLFRDQPATFGFHTLDSAQRRPMEPIPPVEQWGDAARIAAEAEAMHYVDHEPGMWFLVEKRGVLYLDTRYSYSAMIDDSALIRLSDAEVAAYRAGGHDYLTGLSRAIHDSAPYREDSPYYARDLYRRGGEAGPRPTRDEVTAAIMNHTWIARQRAQR